MSGNQPAVTRSQFDNRPVVVGTSARLQSGEYNLDKPFWWFPQARYAWHLPRYNAALYCYEFGYSGMGPRPKRAVRLQLKTVCCRKTSLIIASRLLITSRSTELVMIININRYRSIICYMSYYGIIVGIMIPSNVYCVQVCVCVSIRSYVLHSFQSSCKRLDFYTEIPIKMSALLPIAFQSQPFRQLSYQQSM